jgi:hypothetical protein
MYVGNLLFRPKAGRDAWRPFSLANQPKNQASLHLRKGSGARREGNLGHFRKRHPRDFSPNSARFVATGHYSVMISELS